MALVDVSKHEYPQEFFFSFPLLSLTYIRRYSPEDLLFTENKQIDNIYANRTKIKRQ
jgi:hypothetical protein